MDETRKPIPLNYSPRTPARQRVGRVVRRIAIGSLVVGVFVYATSFYALVRLEGPGGTTGAPPWGKHAEYPFSDELAHRLYGPMEMFDEWLRPRAWQWWGFADECVPAYEYLMSQEWPDELQPEAAALLSAIDDTWAFLGSDIDSLRESLKFGVGAQAELDAAIAKRKQLVDRALEAEKKFRVRVAAVWPGH